MAAHLPIIFPLNKTILVGIINDGKNIIEIKDIPRKKKNKNRSFLIIFVKN
jgi:hypothetical protein